MYLNFSVGAIFRTVSEASSIGVTQLAMSGGLDSTTVTYMTAPTFPFGRGDMGRMPVFTQTDMNLSHTFRIGEHVGLKLEANAINLLNQAAVISRVTQMNFNGNITRDQLPLSQLLAGYKLSDFVRPGTFELQRDLWIAWQRPGGWRRHVSRRQIRSEQRLSRQ